MFRKKWMTEERARDFGQIKMKIQWNKVTWYSKLVAVIVFILVLLLGIYIGREYEKITQEVAPELSL